MATTTPGEQTSPAILAAQYSLGPVRPVTEQAAGILGPMFGIKTIYGWRKSDPFPDHPSGHALDFMVPDKETGDRLAQYAITNAGPLGVDYIVWYRQSWKSTRGTWKPYSQPGQPPHTDHVHITFKDETSGGPINPVGAAADTLLSWIKAPSNLTEAVSNVGEAGRSLATTALSIGKVADLVTKAFLPTNILRGVAGFMGVIFILIGIWFLSREVRESPA